MKYRTIFTSAMVGVILSSNAYAASYKLNMGTVLAPDNPITQGLQYFKKAVEEATDGDIKISVFPSGQLGGTLELIEQARAGSNVSMMADPSRLQDYTEEFGVLASPYIFSSYEQSQKFYTSQQFKEWESQLEERGNLVILSPNWFQGTRMLITQNAVDKPEDLKGVRIRAAGSPVGIKTVEVLGGIATPMPWNEVYTALQQKVIDGAEVHPAAFYDSKLYEVIKYIQPTEHAYLMSYLTVGENWFNSLPEEYKKIIQEKAVEAGDYASSIIIKNERSYLEQSIKHGMIYHEIDKAKFIGNAKGVFKDLGMEDAYQKVLSASK